MAELDPRAAGRAFRLFVTTPKTFKMRPSGGEGPLIAHQRISQHQRHKAPGAVSIIDAALPPSSSPSASRSSPTISLGVCFLPYGEFFSAYGVG